VYTASVVDEQNMGMEQWWSDTDGETPKNLQQNFSQRHSFRHRFYINEPGIEDGRPP